MQGEEVADLLKGGGLDAPLLLLVVMTVKSCTVVVLALRTLRPLKTCLQQTGKWLPC